MTKPSNMAASVRTQPLVSRISSEARVRFISSSRAAYSASDGIESNPFFARNMLRGSGKSEMRSRKAERKLTVNSAIALIGKLIHVTSCHTFLLISAMRISWYIDTGSHKLKIFGVFTVKQSCRFRKPIF